MNDVSVNAVARNKPAIIADLKAPKRPFFYPKDAPMEGLLALDAPLNCLKFSEQSDNIPERSLVVRVEEGLKMLRGFASRLTRAS